MQSVGVENVEPRVRLGKGLDENQSKEKSLPKILEYESARMSERSSSSSHPPSGSHSNAVS